MDHGLGNMPNAYHYSNTFDDALAAQFKGVLSMGFDPRQIDDLRLWLDITNPKTLQIDSSNGIALVQDRSSLGNNAAQSNASLRMQYAANGINGKSAIHATATNQQLQIPDHASLRFSDAYTMFMVVLYASDNNNWPVLYSKTSNYGTIADGYGMRLHLNSEDKFVSWGAQGGIATINGVEASANVNTFKAITINTPYIFSSTNSAVITTPSVASIIGGQGPDFYIGEIIIYGRALSTAIRKQVEAYLSAKWNIAIQV